MSYTRDRRRRLCLIGVALVIVAFLIAVGTLIPFREWHRLVELRDNGANAPARVTKFETDIAGRRATDVIQFEFQPAQGTPRTGVHASDSGARIHSRCNARVAAGPTGIAFCASAGLSLPDGRASRSQLNEDAPPLLGQ